MVIRSNSIIYNPRVGKIAKSLSKAYSVSVLGWNREGLSKKITSNYIVDLKLLRLKAPIGKLYLFMYFPLYWIWILVQLLLVYRPKAVHACDLDSAIPAYLYKVISGNRLVFDVCDRYAMRNVTQKLKVLCPLVNLLEELIGEKSDVLINVSAKLLDTFRRRPNRCAIIMNCSEDRAVNSDITSEDKTENRDHKTLKLLYTGNITRTRGLKELSTAISDLDYVQLDIAGRVMDKELLNEILLLPNIKYHGLLRPSDIWALQEQSDVIIALYDLNIPISKFSMGNKIFDSMMCGLPVITNVASELIGEARCGIKVNYDDLNQIKTTVINLRDNADLRDSLGNNGRKAFLEKYNWTTMEKELYRIYDDLLEEPIR